MLGVIVAVIGGFGGTVITGFLKKKKRGKVSLLLEKINGAYSQFRSNSSKCEAELLNLKEEIDNHFTDGTLTDQGYAILKKRIDKYLADVRKGVVSSGFDLSSDNKNELNNMLEDGKISEKEYELFKKLKLDNLSASEQKNLDKLMTDWSVNEKKK